MKKAVLLIVMCLMATSVLSLIVSADDNVGVQDIDIYVITPKPLPYVVLYNESIELDWNIHRIREEKVNYFIEIYEFNKPERVVEVDEPLSFTMSEGQRAVEGNMKLLISRKKFPVIGKYEVKIECPGVGKESKYFKVGEGAKLVVNKFYDANMNGEKDINERSLSGWDFTIIYNDNPEAISPTGTTGADGTCTWIDLASGNYTIIETLKKCWNTTSKSKEVKLKEGETTFESFGNYEVGTLKITKYNDTNKNSEIDYADEKLPGWEFQVTDPDGKTSNYITDGNGEIKIDVPVGTYTVKEQLKDGWIAITPIKQRKTVKKCEETPVEFLNAPPNLTGTLFINKFNDINQNKVQDDGEEGLPNWEFTVTKDGTTVATCTTNETGFCTLKLEEGKYTVTEHSKHCWKSTTPTSVETWIRTDQPSEVKFGNYGFGTLVIHKFEDSDSDGVQDAGEKDLANCVFEVTQDGRTVDKCTTEEDGSCKLELPAGRYTITEELKRGWIATTSIMQEAEVKVCQETRLSFGNNRSIPLRITKYYDHNANGKRDSGEEGIGNWGYKIKYPNGSVETVTTDSNGTYERYDPPTGKYTISEQPQPCWKNSTPRVVRDVEITPDRGAEVEFGNFEVGNLTIQKFYDPSRNKVQEYGEDGLPNWTFTITFPDGSSKGITTDANGTYTLINVPIGRYTITEETMTCRWMNSTSTTQDFEVTACQETIASFGNYIADCSIPPGCPWFNEDENLNVSKSVVPCVCNITLLREGESTSKEGEPEVSVYLRVCVDKRLIKDGIAVENITVVETLYNHFTVVEDSFSEQPSNTWRNPDGTTTMVWYIPSLYCEEWLVSFNATPEYALPIDVTNTSGQVTSKVIYEDPIETGRRELSIPEGKLKFSFIVPPAPIHPICYILGGLLVIAISIEIPLEWKRRKKEKSKEKEKE